MGVRVATGREVIVGSMLILIRGSLVALTPRLVEIRPCLILITPRLVEIRPCLSLITRRLVAINRRPSADLITRTGQELGATRRTARNPGHLSTGWTFHTLRHRLPFSRARPLPCRL